MLISEIKCNGSEFNNYIGEDGNKLTQLKNLSKINIFIGPNNSGKSRFMRMIAKIKKEDLEYKLSDNSFQQFEQNVIKLIDIYKNILNKYKNNIADGFLGKINVGKNAKELKDYIPEYFKDDGTEKYDILKSLGSGLDVLKISSTYGSNPERQIAAEWNEIKKHNNEAKKLLEEIGKFTFSRLTYSKTYYPILRSLNSLEKYTKDAIDVLSERTRSVYRFYENPDKNSIPNDVEIFSGQNLYQESKKMLLGDKEDREKMRKFEEFLSKELYNGASVTIIPKEKDNNDVIHVSLNGDERPIYDLGDGIQSIIILLFNSFMQKKGIFFIEEPELTLHPGMQRKLIEVMKKFDHQYFITTHSNHLLDLTLDYSGMSVYKFEDIGDNKKVIQVEKGNRGLLSSLGIQNSSVFLSNTTIWVEGVNDRLYLRKFLDLYKEYICENEDYINISEDIDYSFVEYGGSNITHWSFLDEIAQDDTIDIDKLCGKSFVICDNDHNTKKERKQALTKKLKDRFYELKCNEIENILPRNVISSIVDKYEGGADWNKEEQELENEYSTKSLGEFIESNLKSIKRKGGYKTESGTIKDKNNFRKKTLSKIEDYNDLTPEAKFLTKKIYEFIIGEKNPPTSHPATSPISVTPATA